ncbi:PE family protein [Mycobacterium marinum]|uniref:PE family protein n=1 Tax=Mycobacterium marinum TaxID=1781 RepID=A0A2Z5YLE0_MYCMR|nr:PE family protein [Mycobacterium marinum]AXN46207.1 PE family protein [Mycobacterium marinum]AXN51630.1 PE family protein [Mycobacterium marinum]EPQ74375.1 PE-PGRS family protein [Mycobacterium marinum str. Europe]EPQ77981.1 PE-PGRS family protein [Mycobacterium marinum MB2]MDC9007754.1 PE family protein [Mycobacterium marinum]
MSYVAAVPEALTAAASDVAGIGTTISSANAAASAPTTGVLAAAGDQVSAQVAALFSSHGEIYQRLSSQLSTFHDQFAAALNTSANSYASAEANAAKTLLSAVNSPAEKLLGQPLMGQGGIVANAVSQVQSVFAGAGSNALGANASMLALAPTGGAATAAASGSLLGPIASAAAAPAAILPVSVATAIQNFYLAVEPWVQYGFNLASWAVGWVPWIGILAPQINFFYYLFEPIVQSGLFNTLDWLDGTITFSQGLSNFWSATTASVNQFIQTEINWIRNFFPPFPPLPF